MDKTMWLGRIGTLLLVVVLADSFFVHFLPGIVRKILLILSLLLTLTDIILHKKSRQ